MSKIDWTKPIQTKDGKPARVLATDLKGHNLPILVAITTAPNKELLAHCAEDGGLRPFVFPEVCIINVPEKRVMYLNIYPGSIDSEWSPLLASEWHTREEADKYADTDRLACIRVEWQDGQFDE